MSTVLVNSKLDDPEATSLSSYLSLADINIIQCDNQSRLVTALHQEQVDLIILCLADDIVKGFSLLKTLREKTQIPIIILASRGDESDRIMAFELGCDDYLTAPSATRRSRCASWRASSAPAWASRRPRAPPSSTVRVR